MRPIAIIVARKISQAVRMNLVGHWTHLDLLHIGIVEIRLQAASVVREVQLRDQPLLSKVSHG